MLRNKQEIEIEENESMIREEEKHKEEILLNNAVDII